MGLVQLPPVQSKSGRYVEGQRIISVTDTDGNAWPCYTAREGGTPVDFGTLRSGPEGEFEAYASPNTVVITYENDLHDNPKTIELVSGEDLEGMLTEDDIPALPGGGIFFPTEYGADPTGATDSTAALVDTIVAANAVNGTVHLGAATNVYSWSSTINFAQDIRMTSYGGGMGGSGNMATLRYTGTGSSAGLSITDRGRWEIDHVRFEVADPTYTGPLINVTHAVVDPTNWWIHNCEFDFDFGGPEVPVFKCYIRLHKVITSKISECHFNGGMTHILMGDPANTNSYCNAVVVDKCSFNDCFPPENGQILIGARDMQACSISNNVFSGGGASGYVAIRGTNTTNSNGGAGESGGDASSNNIYTLQIDNNYFGDGSTGEAIIDGLNTQTDGPILLTNNFFANSYDVCFRGGQNGAGVAAVGNKCLNAPLFGTWDGTAGEGNVAWGFGNKTTEGYYKTGEEYNLADSIRMSSGGINQIGGRLGISNHDNFDDPTLWSTDEAYVIGAKVPNATGLLNIGARAAAYNRTTGTASNNHVVQAGQADNLSQVQLVGGTTPAVKVAANGVGVGFNAATPVGKQTLGSAATDAATTQTLANNIRTALINLGLGQT
jgi:hypothetical protein